MKFRIHTVWHEPVEHPKLKRIANTGNYQECGYEYEVEVNTLEELMTLRKELGNPLILGNESLEIYDDYRE